MTGALENVTLEAIVATSGPEGSVVVIKDSVALTSVEAAGATPADIQSVQVTVNVESQRSRRGIDACEQETAEVVPGFGGLVVALVADVAAVADSTPAGDDGMAKLRRFLRG